MADRSDMASSDDDKFQKKANGRVRAQMRGYDKALRDEGSPEQCCEGAVGLSSKGGEECMRNAT
jgi:hypothetical protein